MRRLLYCVGCMHGGIGAGNGLVDDITFFRIGRVHIEPTGVVGGIGG